MALLAAPGAGLVLEWVIRGLTWLKSLKDIIAKVIESLTFYKEVYSDPINNFTPRAILIKGAINTIIEEDSELFLDLYAELNAANPKPTAA